MFDRDPRTHRGMHVQHDTQAFSKLQYVQVSNLDTIISLIVVHKCVTIPCEHATEEDIKETTMTNSRNAFQMVLLQIYGQTNAVMF